MLGIPQRTLSYYEREADHVPSTMLVKLSEVLGVSVLDLLGLEHEEKRSRGAPSKLQKQFEKVKTLPKKEQDFIVQFLDTFLKSKGNEAVSD